ncbi:hypothetical protein M0R45_023329 [Rubus argutus]|uniref:HAT C-terminal dimerisation domain-containing protein n=1 Tax=Rubus argutus TaxID=59490 RepID=A0AAW1WN46_RUBAR
MDPLHDNIDATQDAQGGNFVENNEIEMEDCQEIKTASPKCGKRRRKLTSNVWSKFEVLPLGADKKQRAKCLRCGIVYLCDSRYGTGNLKRHMTSCMKQKVLDLGQLVVSHNGDGSMITRSARFDPEKFRELLVMVIVMHDLPFQFVDNQNATRSFNDATMVSKECIDVMKDFDDFESEELVFSAQKTQLQLYLDEPKLSRTTLMNVLDFWKANQFRYPELSIMARDVLSIPISTVASESAFSVGGRVLDQYRSALKPETVEALICTRDWIFGKEYSHTLPPKLEDLTEDISKLSNSNANDESVDPSVTGARPNIEI